MPPRALTLPSPPASSDTPTGIEIEANSFSFWNCMITFLQILLVTTIIYGAGWNQGLLQTPQNAEEFKSIAFFFALWAVQALSLSFLLIWAVRSKSHMLCQSWILCELLMQVFVLLGISFFVYQHAIEAEMAAQNMKAPTPSYYNEKGIPGNDDSSQGKKEFCPRPPKHLIFIVVLHFLIKGFGFWTVQRYMRLLRTEMSAANNNNSTDVERNNTSTARQTVQRNSGQASPPPSYATILTLTKDNNTNDNDEEPPGYDEALQLCLKDNIPASTPAPPESETEGLITV